MFHPMWWFTSECRYHTRLVTMYKYDSRTFGGGRSCWNKIDEKMKLHSFRCAPFTGAKLESYSSNSPQFTHHDMIINHLEKGLNLDTLYFDFAKAFDKVDRSLVPKKPSTLGIRETILQWISSFMTSRTHGYLCTYDIRGSTRFWYWITPVSDPHWRHWSIYCNKFQ